MKLHATVPVLAAFVVVGAFFIFCNETPQQYLPPDLLIEATVSDTVVAVRDTVTVTVDTSGTAGRTIRYCWSRDDSWTIDMTAEGRFRAAWRW